MPFARVRNWCMAAEFTVEVAYARPDAQAVIQCRVPAGCTALRAVHSSGILDRFPEIKLVGIELGIFGEVVESGQMLREQDRVEIYRPLAADPKQIRRLRAAASKRGKKPAGPLKGA